MAELSEIKLPWPEWKVVSTLGHGGFGYVYEIERTIVGQVEKSALKIISIPMDDSVLEADYSDGYDDETLAQKYKSELDSVVREYQFMYRLRGESNVVSCEDIATVPQKNGVGWDVYIRMELLTPLHKILKEEEFTEKDVWTLGKDICTALVLCEQSHIIHRDIKPENIMRSKLGSYKLGDFGIARTMEHATNATRIGTIRYMAPEVLRNEKYGPEVDIYSLGLVMYWLLNGRRMPFVPTDRVPTAEEINTAQLKRIDGMVIPKPLYGNEALHAIILKACAFDQKQRYASAKEMLRDLMAVGYEQYDLSGAAAHAGEVPQDGDEKTVLHVNAGKREEFADPDLDKTVLGDMKTKKKSMLPILIVVVVAVVAVVAVLAMKSDVIGGNVGGVTKTQSTYTDASQVTYIDPDMVGTWEMDLNATQINGDYITRLLPSTLIILPDGAFYTRYQDSPLDLDVQLGSGQPAIRITAEDGATDLFDICAQYVASKSVDYDQITVESVEYSFTHRNSSLSSQFDADTENNLLEIHITGTRATSPLETEIVDVEYYFEKSLDGTYYFNALFNGNWIDDAGQTWSFFLNRKGGYAYEMTFQDENGKMKTYSGKYEESSSYITSTRTMRFAFEEFISQEYYLDSYDYNNLYFTSEQGDLHLTRIY